MKYKYRAYKKFNSPHSDYERVPLVQTTLSYKRNSIDLDCLVDSGASLSLFGTSIAKVLGIDLKDARRQTFEGIGDTSISGYTHKIYMQISGFKSVFEAEAGFIDCDEIPILGQKGVFDRYDIIFKGYQKKFEIKRNSR